MTQDNKEKLRKDMSDKIRKIVTFHGDDGTSGYLLSEEQIERIVDLLAQAIEKDRERIVRRLEKEKEEIRYKTHYDRYIRKYYLGWNASLDNSIKIIKNEP